MRAIRMKLRAVRARESAHTAHASQEAARRLIPPTPSPCSLAPSVTTAPLPKTPLLGTSMRLEGGYVPSLH
jgi:hypothetical protein